MTEEKKVPSNSSYYDDVSFDNLDWGNSALLALEVPEPSQTVEVEERFSGSPCLLYPPDFDRGRKSLGKRRSPVIPSLAHPYGDQPTG